jgi:hypothetical protein
MATLDSDDLRALTGYHTVTYVAHTGNAVTSGAALKAAADAASAGHLIRIGAGLYTLGASDRITVNGWTLKGVGEASRINGGTTSSDTPVVALVGTGSVVEDLYLDYTGLRDTTTINFPIGRWTTVDAALTSGVIRRVKVRAHSDCLYLKADNGHESEMLLEDCDFESGIDAGVVQAATGGVLKFRASNSRFTTILVDEEESRWGLKFSGAGVQALIEYTAFTDFDDSGSTLLEASTAKVYLVRCSFNSLNAGSSHITVGAGSVIVNDCQYDDDKTSGTITVVGTHGAEVEGIGSDAISSIIAALGGSTVTYTGPVADNGDVTLYAGADYSGGQSLVWTITEWAGASVNGEAVTLALMRDAKYEKTGGTPDLEVTTGTASQASTTVTVTVPVTAAQTSALLTSPPLDEDHYQLQVRSNTTKQMLVDAECTVRKNALST